MEGSQVEGPLIEGWANSAWLESLPSNTALSADAKESAEVYLVCNFIIMSL